MVARCRIFYTADIHGSERCFRKWLNAVAVYRPDVIIFGGDITGKVLVPIIRTGPNSYLSQQHGEPVKIDGREGLEAFRAQLRAAGQYDVILTPEEKREHDAQPELVARQLFPQVVRDRLKAWIDLADERLGGPGVQAFAMLGNDDYPELSPLLTSDRITNPEDSVVELSGGFEMISLGFSNKTPWDSPRELSEEEIAARVETMAAQLRDPASAVFNIHCPPRDTYIDQAALLDENFRPRMTGTQMQVAGVGSTAVREAIQKYQPMLGLHGHIHESPGAQKLGRTLVVNPGSDYADGVLRGALITLDTKKGVRSWQLIQG